MSEPRDGSLPRVRPLRLVPGPEIEAWNDPEIEAYARASLRDGVPAPTSLAIEASAPRVLRAFGRFWWTAFRGGTVDPGLKERIRLVMALAAGCTYCATSAPVVKDDAAAADETGADGADPDYLVASGRDALALDAADRLASRPWALDDELRAALVAAFSPGEVAELLAFMAWQAGGPRAIRAWGAEAYKPGARVDPAALPVPLAYAGATGPVPGVASLPAADPVATLARSAATGWPPAAWVRMLAPRPEILAAWCALSDATTTGDPLGDRLGAIVRSTVGQALLVPAWAPGAPVPATPAERLVADYARALAVRGEVPDDLRAAALETFGDAGVVQLGFAVASQAGPALVVRWFGGGAPRPIALVD